jgi:hypothetical protein
VHASSGGQRNHRNGKGDKTREKKKQKHVLKSEKNKGLAQKVFSVRWMRRADGREDVGVGRQALLSRMLQ